MQTHAMAVKLPKVTIALCVGLGAYVGKQLAWTPPASVAALRALAPPLQLACGALTVLLAYVAVALFCAAVYETDPLENVQGKEHEIDEPMNKHTSWRLGGPAVLRRGAGACASSPARESVRSAPWASG